MDVSSAGRQVPSLLELSDPRRRLAGERDVKPRAPLVFFCSSFPKCHAVTRLAPPDPLPPRPGWGSLGYFKLLCQACLRGAVQRSLLHDTHTCTTYVFELCNRFEECILDSVLRQLKTQLFDTPVHVQIGENITFCQQGGKICLVGPPSEQCWGVIYY